MLVESGIIEAGKLGLDVFVHAKTAGLGVYQRAGFRLLDRVILDDSAYGGKGAYGSYFLVKEVGEGKSKREDEDEEKEKGSSLAKSVERTPVDS